MKELSIEEKAKRYDKSLEIARKINSGEGVAAPSGWTTCEVIFPELKESEDERIRKDIITYLSTAEDKELIPYESWIAWLEKQGEAWNEEDEYYYGIVQYILNNERVGKADKENASNWFKSIKDRVQPQPKQEWSEEDEKAINDIMWIIEAYREKGFNETHIQMADNSEKWLMSLRPQSTWKPSDEQMAALSGINVTGCISYAGQGQELINLYNDLKKLTK